MNILDEDRLRSCEVEKIVRLLEYKGIVPPTRRRGELITVYRNRLARVVVAALASEAFA